MTCVFEVHRTRVAVVVCTIIFLSGAVSAQAATTKLYHNASGVPAPDDLAPDELVGSPVAIDGNTAVVSASFGAYVVETDGVSGWHFVTRLPLPGYGVAISGDTIAIPSGTQVYVFDRNEGGPDAWGRVALLAGGEEAVVAIDGDTIVVGLHHAGSTAPNPPFVFGVADVYQRDRGGPNAWGLVAELTPTHDSGSFELFFGSSVSVSGGTIIVGGFEYFPTGTCTPHDEYGCLPDYLESFFADVFERDHGGPNAWGRAAVLPLGLPMTELGFVNLEVAIDGNTAVAAANNIGAGPPNVLQIFDRQPGGHAWTRVARLTAAYASFSGGRLAAHNSQGRVEIYARNQGGPNAWGLADTLSITGQGSQFGQGVSMSGDAVLVGDPCGYWLGECPDAVAYVFESDLDRDDITDGHDQCPQDPLNNVAAGCRRSPSASAIMDNVMEMSGMTTASKNGDYLVTATFRNTSNGAILNPFFSVSELSGGNVLKNGDGGPYGVGATLSPDVGDGLLSPGESTRVTFVIGLAVRQPFRFVIHVQGDFP